MALDNAAMNSRLVVILIIIVGLISSVGLIISAVALGRPMAPDISISQSYNSVPLIADWMKNAAGMVPAPTPSPTASSRKKREVHQLMYEPAQPDQHTAKSVWTVAVGYDNGVHDYRDESGSPQGLGKDMVDTVCSALGIDCRVVYDRYQNCWTSEPNQFPSGGQGLLGQWYDACIGWAPTNDRKNVFDFSPAHTKPAKASLYSLSTEKLNNFNMNEKKIAFIRGFAEDEECLVENMADMTLPADSVVYVNTPREAVSMLKQGKVSGLFANDDVMAPYIADDAITMVTGSSQYTCTQGGYALMTRKDSNFLPLWNKGVESIMKSGMYDAMCAKAAKTHGFRGPINCLED